MPQKKYKPKNDAEYKALMKRIDTLMKKGEENLTKADFKNLRGMAEAAEAYEDEPISIKVQPPKNISEMVRLRMFEMKINNQAELARLIKIDTPKLSQILKGKRKPDITFLKAAHKKLNIDANFLL